MVQILGPLLALLSTVAVVTANCPYDKWDWLGSGTLKLVDQKGKVAGCMQKDSRFSSNLDTCVRVGGNQTTTINLWGQTYGYYQNFNYTDGYCTFADDTKPLVCNATTFVESKWLLESGWNQYIDYHLLVWRGILGYELESRKPVSSKPEYLKLSGCYLDDGCPELPGGAYALVWGGTILPW